MPTVWPARPHRPSSAAKFSAGRRKRSGAFTNPTAPKRRCRSRRTKSKPNLLLSPRARRFCGGRSLLCPSVFSNTPYHRIAGSSIICPSVPALPPPVLLGIASPSKCIQVVPKKTGCRNIQPKAAAPLAACRSSHYAKTAGCSAATVFSGSAGGQPLCKICVRLVFPAIALAQHHQHHNRSRRSNRHNGQRYHGQCVTGFAVSANSAVQPASGSAQPKDLRSAAGPRSAEALRLAADFHSAEGLRSGWGSFPGSVWGSGPASHSPRCSTRSGRGAWPRCSAWPRRGARSGRGARSRRRGGLGRRGIGVQKAHRGSLFVRVLVLACEDLVGQPTILGVGHLNDDGVHRIVIGHVLGFTGRLPYCVDIITPAR